MSIPIRLGVNIDHVATIRNARGGEHPDPVAAALSLVGQGTDGITAHLREDRRHIRDDDMFRLKAEVPLPLNFEMAATEEMLEIALKVQPNACCLVPEKRQELTTEGGLDVAGQVTRLKEFIMPLRGAGIRVSLFIDADAVQVTGAKEVAADSVEIHTGRYCEYFVPPPEGRRPGRADRPQDEPAESQKGLGLSANYSHLISPLQGEEQANRELTRIREAITLAHALGLECHAGHGLSYETVGPIAAMPEIVELNIGHFLVGQAVFEGLPQAVRRMKEVMLSASNKID